MRLATTDDKSEDAVERRKAWKLTRDQIGTPPSGSPGQWAFLRRLLSRDFLSGNGQLRRTGPLFWWSLDFAFHRQSSDG
jgi:hypothetical protein